MQIKRQVTVWDSNPFNPYGGEVARVISGLGYPVRRYCRPETMLGLEGVRERPIIPRATGGRRTHMSTFGHVIALGILFWTVAFGRSVLVLPWTEKHERPVFQLLQAIGVRIVIVVHNPVADRDEAEKDDRLVALRRRASAIVVHSERLADRARPLGRVVVAGHPSYSGWVNRMERVSGAVSPRDVPSEPVALYLGSARTDKGFGSVPALARLMRAYGVRLRVAVGMLSEQQRAQLTATGNVLLPPPATSYLADGDVFAALAEASVMVAPYSNVTVSGTTIMALTLRLPVVAFDSEGMSDLLGSSHLVPRGNIDAMVERVVAVINHGLSSESDLTPEAIDRTSAAGWRGVLESLG